MTYREGALRIVYWMRRMITRVGISQCFACVHVPKQKAISLKIKKISSQVGLEPTTFELEVQCANPLRHWDTYFYN